MSPTTLNYSGYSPWEISILEKLNHEGGKEGEESARYIVKNKIHIKVGEPFEYRKPLSRRFLKGDWESLFTVHAWWKGDKLVVLNPNAGYSEDDVPSDWGISLVAHEAKHISQGMHARTKRGEMEAWQYGLKIFKRFGGKVDKGRNRDVLEAKTVDDFVKAIKKYDKDYWVGLRFYPPWVPPYDKYP